MLQSQKKSITMSQNGGYDGVLRLIKNSQIPLEAKLITISPTSTIFTPIFVRKKLLLGTGTKYNGCMEITLDELILGFEQAYARIKDAKNQRERLEVFFALFETLNWIITIDDKLQEKEKEWYKKLEKDGETVRALRYARNRVHHQWADVVLITNGVAIPTTIPLSFHEWIWKRIENIPPENPNYPDPEGKKLYKELLEDRPVRYSLQTMSHIFNNLKSTH